MRVLSFLAFISTTNAFFTAHNPALRKAHPLFLSTETSNNNAEKNSSIQNSDNRRNFLNKFVGASVASILAQSTIATTNPAQAADSSLVDVYFGTGCYWHIQHEFILAEQKLLKRKSVDFTSMTGYAGGTAADKQGRVCYHNFQGVADYGKLGHGEVVGMTIPQSSIGDFAKEYFSYFTEKGERVDPMDRGGEYRALIGLPGGMENPYYQEVLDAATAKGMKLELGKGNDPDTLGTKKVYVYDIQKFPFYQAEIYHQYHNDFQSPAYGKEYNNLANTAFERGGLKLTGCPDRV